MTSIAGRLLSRDCRLGCLGSLDRRLNSADLKDLLDVGNDALEQPAAPKQVATRHTHLPLDRCAIALALQDPARGLEGGGRGGFELIDVGDIIDEGLRLAAMQETNRRRIARSQDRSLAEAIEASRGRRQGTIGDVGIVPILAVVVALVPIDATALGQELIHFAHACAFDPAQLLDRAAGRRLLVEAASVHLAHDLETSLLVEREASLKQQPVGPSAARLAASIEADTALADPDQEAADPSRQDNGSVADAGARLQHQAGEAADWNLCTDSSLVNDDEGAVSSASSSPYCRKTIDDLSFIGIGFKGM